MGGGWVTGKPQFPLLHFSRAFLLTPRKVQLSGISCRCNPSPKNIKLPFKGGLDGRWFIHPAWQTTRAPFSGRCHRTARDVVSIVANQHCVVSPVLGVGGIDILLCISVIY